MNLSRKACFVFSYGGITYHLLSDQNSQQMMNDVCPSRSANVGPNVSDIYFLHILCLYKGLVM